MPTFNWASCPPKFSNLFKATADSKNNSLNLINLRLTHEDILCIVEFVNEHQTTSLDLSCNDINDEDAIALSQCASLTSLNVQKNNIGNTGATAIANMKLEELNISQNQVTSLGAKALANSKTLKTLNIGNNDIGVPGAKALALNEIITTLCVNRNGIRDLGAIALAGNKTLKVLNVAFNQITNKSTVAFSQNDTLETLDLSSNGIDNEGAAILVQNEKLLDLIIRTNAIEDEGAIAFANRIKPFRTLDIRDNDISDIVMGALMKRQQEEIDKQKTQASTLTILEKELSQPTPLSEISLMPPPVKVLHSCAFPSEATPMLPSKSTQSTPLP